MLRLLLFIPLIIVCLPGKTQQRCGTVEYMHMQRKLGKIRQTDEQFEQWLARQGRNMLRQQQARRESGPYRIPVVIHVIHNGEPLGTGTNISDAQILSQLEVINKDFKRLNADAVNTPPEFAAVAGSMDIEFVLALRDPYGLPTSGIVRVNGGRTSWAVSQETQFKALSYWPSEDYLNIWVLNLSGGFIGYAQFPVSNLPGLEEYQDGIAATDGVVIDYKAFGSIDYGSFDLDPDYNKGRTLTHELGHFFGLRHIWGDQLCGTDYVDDTPRQRNETIGCPTHPATTTCTTTVNKMFQNYLDYTDDACMNLFTQGQVARMQLILDNPAVPRRNSLLTSPGLLPANCSQPDVALLEKTMPGPVTCNNRPTLIMKVRSLSCDPISTLKVQYRVNSGSLLTTIFTGLNLLPGSVTELSFGTLTLQPGVNTLFAKVLEVNGLSDGNPNNSEFSQRILLDTSTDRIPLRERFNELNWPVINPTNGSEWQLHTTNFNLSASFRAFQAPDGPNESWLVTPTLDFSGVTKASMFFDLSYAWNGSDNDRLRILVSTDCGDTFQQVLPPFDRTGLALANAISPLSWQPENESQWQLKRYVNLSDYAGYEHVRIAFVFTNNQGNNIYIDNVEFFLSDDPDPLFLQDGPFAVYWETLSEAKVTFNLEERSDVFVEILDAAGRRISGTTLPDVLNQTYSITTGLANEGLYIFRAHIGGRRYALKFFLTRP
ncbi:MAG: zinc metalloprotease [Cyclobacteriaceae bacterium]|nr:zinc metalloprotease [Cyclobacteriaceae bacterium]